MMRYIDLFAGIGGLSLGFDRAGMTCVGHVEIDEWNRRLLAKHWPGVWMHDDVTTLEPSQMPRMDLLTGGFPCTDLSYAGKRAGIDGERSGLYKEMCRVIDAVRPEWVVIENVPALRSSGGKRVVAELERVGYDVWPVLVPAATVGAPHIRNRAFIIAHNLANRHSDRQPRVAELHALPWWSEGRGHADGRDAQMEHAGSRSADAEPQRQHQGRQMPARPGKLADPDQEHLRQLEQRRELEPSSERATGPARDGEVSDAASVSGETEHRVADTGAPGPEERDAAALAGTEGHPARRSHSPVAQPCGGGWPALPGQVQHDWEEPRVLLGARVRRLWDRHGKDFAAMGGPSRLSDVAERLERTLGLSVDGVSSRLVRADNKAGVAGVGNAVCPVVAEVLGRAILRLDAER